jgi:hypothetical protein
MNETDAQRHQAESGPAAGHDGTAAPATTTPTAQDEKSWQRPSWLRITLALGIAIASDVFSFLTGSLIVTFPAVLAVDVVTAALLWLALGRPLILLPILLAEAVPGVGTLPLWTVAVVLISIFGGIPGRDHRKALTDVTNRFTGQSDSPKS